jgi:hypothetical protein
MIVSFTNITAPARFDDVAWTQMKIEEAATSAGTWALIDTLDVPGGGDPANPNPHNYTTIHGTGPDLWYRLTFVDAAAGESAPTAPAQNTDSITAYALTDDLFRILKVNSPSASQTTAAQGDLDTATIEINSEIDVAADRLFTVEELELLKDVCVNRAADLWRHRESMPGILGITDETLPSTPGRYSFARYVARLSVMKDQWGIA